MHEDWRRSPHGRRILLGQHGGFPLYSPVIRNPKLWSPHVRDSKNWQVWSPDRQFQEIEKEKRGN